VARASAEYDGGMDACDRRVRMELFNVRSTRSTLPFCGEV
jgi:hypothetical protein